jgi:hypothetical protein
MYIRSKLDFADIVWDNCKATETKRLEIIQNEAARIITGLPLFCPINDLLDECNFTTLRKRRLDRRLTLFYKMYNGISPRYLQTMLPISRVESENHDFRDLFELPPVEWNYAFYRDSFLPRTIRDWNELPIVV